MINVELEGTFAQEEGRAHDGLIIHDASDLTLEDGRPRHQDLAIAGSYFGYTAG